VTNGKSILPNVDGRSFWVRRFRDLIALHTNDLGGDDVASESEKAIIRRAATIMCELERREMLFAQAGRASDTALETYQRSANTMRRLLQALGLQRRSRDVTPSLSEYLHARAASNDDAEAAE
jgi:hypothetical protein